MGEELLKIDEVAEACRTSTSTVRWWIGQGRLRSLKVGRRRLVYASDLTAFLVACESPPSGAGTATNA